MNTTYTSPLKLTREIWDESLACQITNRMSRKSNFQI